MFPEKCNVARKGKEGPREERRGEEDATYYSCRPRASPTAPSEKGDGWIENETERERERERETEKEREREREREEGRGEIERERERE